MGYIGHHTHVEFTSRHTMLRQPMRCGFQNAVGQSLFNHLAQQGLQVHRIRGRYMQPRIENCAANLCLYGADEPCGQARASQDIKDHGSGGGLSIGAGDPNHHQLPRGNSMPGGCQIGIGKP